MNGVTITNLSRETVLGLDLAGTSELIHRVGEAYKRRAREDVIRAAFATYAAYRQGILVDRGGYRIPGITMTTKEFAGQFGLTSQANVTLWRTIGIALCDVGLDPDGDTMRLILSKNLGQVTDVARVIRTPGATEADVKAAITLVTDEVGNVMREQRVAPTPMTAAALLHRQLVAVEDTLMVMSSADFAEGVAMVTEVVTRCQAARMTTV